MNSTKHKSFSIKTVAIVYKRTVYENYISTSDASHLFKQKSNTSHFLKTHQSHQKSLEQVRQFFKNRGVKLLCMPREKMKSLVKADLVVTVGGDGTFLKASHYVCHQPILGVNSVPGISVGALLSVKIDQFASKMEEIWEGNFKIEKINRMSVSINEKIVKEQPLNDILFANQSPAGVCRYEIVLGKKREVQRGSGLWISSAIGSSAAIFAAGGKVMPRSSKQIQFLVREPFSGHRNEPYQLLQGYVQPRKELILNNQTINGALYIDGLQSVYPLAFGDQIRVVNSNAPLCIIKP